VSKFLSVTGYAVTTAIAAFIIALWVEPTTAAGVVVLCVVGLLLGLLEAAAIAIYFHRAPVIAGGAIKSAIGALFVLLVSLQMGPPNNMSGVIFFMLVCAIAGVVSGFIYRLAGLIGAPKKDQFIGG
jgi:hypothetical protein